MNINFLTHNSENKTTDYTETNLFDLHVGVMPLT